MTCRRAFEIDLAAFLAEPRAVVWDDFRAHYPRCVDCAAEVAAWTMLQAMLDARHPDEETLLRFADEPGALAADERARVAAHLERCPACADELRALARFAGDEAISQPAPAGGRRASHTRGASTRPGGGASGRPSALRRIGRVLWHPALPYAALLVLVLLPAFRERFAGLLAERPAATPPAADERRVAGRDVAARFERRAAEEGPRPARAQRAMQAAGEADTRSARAGSETPAAPAAAPARDALRAAPAAAPEALADAAAPATGAREGVAPVELTGDRASAVRTLVVLLPSPASRAATYAVRVAAAGGTREIRQVVTASPGAERLTVELPGSWLEPGGYEVEVAAQGGAPLLREAFTVPAG